MSSLSFNSTTAGCIISSKSFKMLLSLFLACTMTIGLPPGDQISTLSALPPSVSLQCENGSLQFIRTTRGSSHSSYFWKLLSLVIVFVNFSHLNHNEPAFGSFGCP